MKATGIIVLILVIFAAAVLAEVWRELHCFKITRYRIRTSKIKGDAGKVRIAFLSDLHNHVYGKENEELLLALREAKPDLILAAGDILERCTEGESQYTKAEMDAWQGLRKKNKIASGAMKTVMKIGYNMHEKHEFSEGIEFLKEASEIAPVFYSPGNHEWYFTKEDQKVFSEKRIFLLENEDICWNLVENRLVSKSECGNNRKAVKDPGLRRGSSPHIRLSAHVSRWFQGYRPPHIPLL